ncbi:hypothetical protein AWE78_19730 [Escherichia coli]|nr:hypothetical protein AWE78_19730 [Escherichia coli]KZI29195.1 hypothetical protein AWG66_01055 [Escherichia coli]
MTGIVFGLCLSTASTVVLLRALEERQLIDSQRGQIAIGWLIVEDLVMVLTLVLLPAVAGMMEQGDVGFATLAVDMGITIGKVIAFIAIMMLVGRRLVPWIMARSAATGSRELFTLSVLAVERHKPNTIPVINDQPSTAESAIPSSVATAIWAIAPGMAMAFTAIKSFSEKCKPTPNINRMTPSSASSGASLVSATKPGVNGPASTPANRYPTRGEIRSLLASMPRIKASTRPPTMVVISGVA